MTLQGKVALVTGSTKGLGKAIAACFASLGADVVVNYSKDKVAADYVVKAATTSGVKAISVKEVANSSAQLAERAIRQIPGDSYGSEKGLRDFRDTVLNSRAELLAVYKIAVLEARRTDSPEEITAILARNASLLSNSGRHVARLARL